jgi:hypothetical protein
LQIQGLQLEIAPKPHFSAKRFVFHKYSLFEGAFRKASKENKIFTVNFKKIQNQTIVTKAEQGIEKSMLTPKILSNINV